MNTQRAVSTPHLVFGIIFTGIAALWLIGHATDAGVHDTAPGFPVVLIGAGIVGLIASVVNARRRSRAQAAPLPSYDEPTETTETTEPTTVLDESAEDTTVLDTPENHDNHDNPEQENR